MKTMTVCFLLKGGSTRKVLLGLKKTGFGAGKYAGIGGKVESGETNDAAAVREVEEETGVKIYLEDLQYMGKIAFLFPAKGEWNQDVSIYTVERWSGSPAESKEMSPVWFDFEAVPYTNMWQDARHWLPSVLEGMKIEAHITFEDDNETVRKVPIAQGKTAEPEAGLEYEE